MKKVLVFVSVVTLIVLALLCNTKTQAQTQTTNIYLPIVFKDYALPVWVKNPQNLPPANGWPGWSGFSLPFQVNCPADCNFIISIEGHYYWILEGTIADVPPLGTLGSESGCFGVLVTQPWEWKQENMIYFPTGQAKHTWMKVLDFSLAPPLEWAAQMREQVIEDIPGCIEPDIGIYYRP